MIHRLWINRRLGTEEENIESVNMETYRERNIFKK